MASIVYWNICGEYGLEENENDRANILWDFQAHADKLLKAKYEKQFIVLKHMNRGVMPLHIFTDICMCLKITQRSSYQIECKSMNER